MAKKKNREEQIEETRSKLEEARQRRLEAIKNLDKKEEKPQEGATFEEFQSWWASNRKKFKKEKDLETVLWPHLKSAGFNFKEKFEEGILHFGLKK